MWWIWIVISLVAILWFFFSLKIIGPDEMAVWVIIGKPKAFRNSGLCFVPLFPGCYLERRPKTEYKFDYAARRFVTKKGEYNGTTYGAVVYTVDAVAYLHFPREKEKEREKKPHPLIEIVKSGIPVEPEKLKEWTQASVDAALREVFGNMIWIEPIEKESKLRERVDKAFTEEKRALRKVGFRAEDIRLDIKEIIPPPELMKSLLHVERERLELQAAPFEAKERAEETVGTVIQMMAEARGEKPEVIQKEIGKSEELKREFLQHSFDLLHRRMGIDGKAYVDIRTGNIGEKGDKSFLDSIKEILIDLIAAWKRMPTGRPDEKEKEEKKETRKMKFLGFDFEVPAEEET